MPGARFLSGEKAWARIREGARRGPAHVAVAWWGSDMSRRIPLKAGSVLVVRADKVTMECGQTNPWELEKLVKGGVRVFPLRNLHAKVFVFEKWAVVGSMNASTNSWAGGLLEAGIEVSGAPVNAARRQVLAWALDKALDLEDLAELKRQYKPPQMVGGSKRIAKASNTPTRGEVDLPKLKILRTTVREGWKKHTQSRFDADSPRLKQEAARQGEDIEGIEWTGTAPVTSDDTRILEVTTDSDDSVWLNAPASLRLVSGTKRGEPEKLIYLARTKALRRRRLTVVRKMVGSRLFRLLKGKGRGFSSPTDLARLFGLWRGHR